MTTVGPIYGATAVGTADYAQTWTTPSNATGSTSGTFATIFIGKTLVGNATMTLSGYTFTGPGSSDTINSVSCTVNQWVTASGGMNGATAQLLDSSGAAIGSAATLTVHTTNTGTDTITFGTNPTAAQVVAGLGVAVIANSNDASHSTATFEVDFASLTVDYTAAPAGVTEQRMPPQSPARIMRSGSW